MSNCPGDQLFGVKYVGFIIIDLPKQKRVATANFINEGNCLVSKECALTVSSNKMNYLAETPVFPQNKMYAIDSTFYREHSDGIAAYWGVIKVSFKI